MPVNRGSGSARDVSRMLKVVISMKTCPRAGSSTVCGGNPSASVTVIDLLQLARLEASVRHFRQHEGRAFRHQARRRRAGERRERNALQEVSSVVVHVSTALQSTGMVTFAGSSPRGLAPRISHKKCKLLRLMFSRHGSRCYGFLTRRRRRRSMNRPSFSFFENGSPLYFTESQNSYQFGSSAIPSHSM